MFRFDSNGKLHYTAPGKRNYTAVLQRPKRALLDDEFWSGWIRRYAQFTTAKTAKKNESAFYKRGQHTFVDGDRRFFTRLGA